jgi:hypothetical protein
MGIAKSGERELIQVTIIDYFSSTVLLDRLIYPDVELKDYGETEGDMEAGHSRGACIAGRDQARAAAWRFVWPDTVVVGHAARNDLTALRYRYTRRLLIHTRECENKCWGSEGNAPTHQHRLGRQKSAWSSREGTGGSHSLRGVL